MVPSCVLKMLYQPNLEAWLIVKYSLDDFIQPSLSLITDGNHKPLLFTVKGICSYFNTDFQWHKNTFVTYNDMKQKVFLFFFSSNCFLSPNWRNSDVCSKLVCLFDLKNLENVRKNGLHGFPGDIFKELVLSDIQKVKILSFKKKKPQEPQECVGLSALLSVHFLYCIF